MWLGSTSTLLWSESLVVVVVDLLVGFARGHKVEFLSNWQVNVFEFG